MTKCFSDGSVVDNLKFEEFHFMVRETEPRLESYELEEIGVFDPNCYKKK